MGIVRWDPYRDLLNLQDKMNKLFEESLHRNRLGEDGKLIGSTWNPSVDIYETKDQIILEVELPGVKREEIQIDVTDNTLTLRGERHPKKNVKEENYHCIERGHGAFIRTFTLPVYVRKDKINANLKDGVLEIGIPKITGDKPKQINIEREENGK